MTAARSQLIVNGEKYPLAQAHGSSKKYPDLQATRQNVVNVPI